MTEDIIYAIMFLMMTYYCTILERMTLCHTIQQLPPYPVLFSNRSRVTSAVAS